MIKFVNAKINIGLNITAKRADGYHELETLFYPVGLYNGTPLNQEPFCDILEIHLSSERGRDEFVFTGNPIDCPLDKNLVYRAAEIFCDRSASLGKGRKCFGSMSVILEKHLPDGAGLGGGSADASFTLTALNELCGFPFKKEELIEMAKALGADCPFFIENRPVIARGIGEKMSPVSLDLSGRWALIVKPDIHISTAEAFAGITPVSPRKPIEEIVRLPMECWEEAGLKNDFEPHIFRKYPVLDEIKRALKTHGAKFSSMSGSGSSIYGLFESRETACEARKAMSSPSFLALL